MTTRAVCAAFAALVAFAATVLPCSAAPTGCGDASGPCCLPHPTPACDDPGCCALVCLVDPYCCAQQWDQLCANEASDACTPCSSGAPFNDECAGAPVIDEQFTLFNTALASTSPQPWTCGDSPIVHDLWFRYIHAAPCNANVTASTCLAADFDTVLVVYADACGTTPVACNDNGTDCATRSSVTFPAQPGRAYLIRLGGAVTQVGHGILELKVPSCTAACPADLDGNHLVNGADLGMLLGGWGTASHDLNGDGTVNGADLGILLGAWGSCAG